MSTELTEIKVFEGRQMRAGILELADGNLERRWVCVDLIAAAMPEHPNPDNYYYKLKNDLKKMGSQLLTNCKKLPIRGSNGKTYQMDTVNFEQALRLFQSIPSPRVEPLKMWLAKVGSERVEVEESVDNGALAAGQAMLSADAVASLVSDMVPAVAAKLVPALADAIMPAITDRVAELIGAKLDELMRSVGDSDNVSRLAAEWSAVNSENATYANASRAIDGMSVRDLANKIREAGYACGYNRLLKWMREGGFLIKQRRGYNMPTQISLERGLMAVNDPVVVQIGRTTARHKVVVVTGRGATYFAKRFIDQVRAREDGKQLSFLGLP